MTLMELLEVVNEGQLIDIEDANTGELYVYDTECEEFILNSEEDDSIFDATVMDVNCYANVLTICIELNEEE